MLRRLESDEPVDLLEMLFAENRGRVGGAQPVAEGHPPWVMLNMVSSIDGATALRGGATALNDADDRALFLAMRAVADVVLVGAQTVRSENMGPIRMSDEMMRYRIEAGLEGEPKMAILTRSLNLSVDDGVFVDPKRRPIVVTEEGADRDRLQTISTVADVVQVPVTDGAGIVGALGDAEVILCEGGPTVNSQLIGAGLVDEIGITMSPLFAMGQSKRIASGIELDPPTGLVLDRILTGDRALFLRYLRE
jgi:riboflavin biosynthesis pyrimidine reductase